MELQRALTDIADIRRQMSLARQFRGFRAATTLATAAVAFAAAMWQSSHAADPIHFVALWVAVAVVCAGACGTELLWRYRRSDSAAQQEMTRTAIEQFLPFIVVGGLLTFVIVKSPADATWMLPGLWQVLFGLGLYSLRRISPAPMLFVAAFYVLCGLVNLSGNIAHFSPWSMGTPFGVGQAFTGLILYCYLERRHVA